LALAGYEVVIDRDCTSEDLLNALKNPDVAVFVFIGHSSSDPETQSYALLATDQGVAPADVESALAGRKLERVELYACSTDNEAWRNAFNRPDKFHGKSRLYNPVLGVDWGKLGGREKKERKKERREQTKRYPFSRKRPK